jgi:hypothetical protein
MKKIQTSVIRRVKTDSGIYPDLPQECTAYECIHAYAHEHRGYVLHCLASVGVLFDMPRPSRSRDLV